MQRDAWALQMLQCVSIRDAHWNEKWGDKTNIDINGTIKKTNVFSDNFS